MEDNHIKVVCRVRPANTKESNHGLRQCVQTREPNEVVLNSKPEPKTFTFDYSADSNVSQEEIFEKIGVPITETVLLGYNGTVLCYGQTGSGKTYTIFGSDLSRADNKSNEQSTSRGLVPRVLDFIWNRIATETEQSNGDKTFTCRCSFYEIYQEKVFDLLDSSGGGNNPGGLSVREDSRHGVYVEGCTQEEVSSPHDASRVLATGYRNRHVGETAMNRESSRSHAVFQLIIDTNEVKGEVRTKRSSRFSMVDLAGSERQKDTNASGDRLKEASQINKSLSALGNVINALADVSSSGTRRHIHYRDSKLTFLLRDSLGGNSKTVLVATVSPADVCFAETLSTLKFAQRAKSIKNAAVVNEETKGSVVALQNEILTLKMQIAEFHAKGGVIGSRSEQTNDDTDNELKLAVRSEIEALKEAMDRCQLADERKVRYQSEVAVLSKRLAETEKSVLSTKMKLKMRDAEVKRLKSKDPEALSEYISTEELLKVDVEAARQEIQSEVVRYKLLYEEQLRRVEKLERGDMPTWVQSQETVFNHDMLQRLLECESKVEEMFFRADAAAQCDFQNACGISVEEALEMREEFSCLKSTVEELRITNDASSMSISSAFNTIRELENSGSEYKASAEHRIAELEAAEEANTAKIASLMESLSAKTTEANDLRENLLRTEESLRQDKESSESARVVEYNKLMKDNMILLKSTRDLQKYATERDNQLKICQERIDTLKQDAEKTNMANQAKVTQMEVKIYALETELKTAKEAASHLEEEMVSRNEKIAELEEKKVSSEQTIAKMESTLSSVRKELERSNFELENSREDADSLYTQAETLMVEIEDIKTELSEAQQQVASLTEEKTSLLDQVELSTNSLATLQNDFAKAQGVISSLEESVSTLTTTVDSKTAENVEMSASLSIKSDRIEELETNISDLTATTHTLQSDITASNETIANLEKDVVSKQSEIEDLGSRIRVAESELASANETVVVLEKGLISKQTEVQELQKEVQTTKNQNDALESEMRTCNETIVVLESGLKTKQSEIYALTEIREKLEFKCASLSEAKNHLESTIEGLEAEINGIGAELEAKQDAVTSLTQDVEELEAQVEVLEAKNKEVKIENATLVDSCAKATSEVELFKAAKKVLESENEELTSKNAELQTELMKAEDVKFTLTNEYSSLSEQCENLKIDIFENKTRIDELSSEIAESENKVICKTNQLSDLAELYDQLKSDMAEKDLCLHESQTELSELSRKYISLESELDSSKEQLADIKAQNSSLESELDSSKEQLADMQRQHCEVANELAESIIKADLLSAEIDELKALKDREIESMGNTLQQLEEMNHSLLDDKENLQASLENAIAERDGIEQKFNNIRRAISAVTTPSCDVPREFSATVDDESSEPIEQLRQALRKNEESNITLQKDLAEITSKLSIANDEVSSLTKEVSCMQQHICELESTIDTHNDERVSYQEDKNAAEKTIADITQELETVQVKLSESLRATEIALSQKRDAEETVEASKEQVAQLEMIKSERDDFQRQVGEAAEHIILRKKELDAVRLELVRARERVQSLESQVTDLTKENTRLCGHQNTKQKIQQHMQLKKNIDEQMNSLKTLQDQLVRVSVERDNAVEECRRLRTLAKNASTTTNTSSSSRLSVKTLESKDTSDVAKKTAASTYLTRRRALMEANQTGAGTQEEGSKQELDL